MIRKAIFSDIDSIKRIADANRDTLGFVMRPALLENIARGWVLIAESDTQIVGFVNYRHRRDAQTTIYEMCVAQEWRGQGLGKKLLDALKQEAIHHGKAYIQLKAISTITANDFYRHYGFKLIGTEPGRKQLLHVWRLTW
jgi:ribosomal protein S18 acetylase RimI-like enzyme